MGPRGEWERTMICYIGSHCVQRDLPSPEGLKRVQEAETAVVSCLLTLAIPTEHPWVSHCIPPISSCQALWPSHIRGRASQKIISLWGWIKYCINIMVFSGRRWVGAVMGFEGKEEKHPIFSKKNYSEWFVELQLHFLDFATPAEALKETKKTIFTRTITSRVSAAWWSRATVSSSQRETQLLLVCFSKVNKKTPTLQDRIPFCP